MLFGLILLAGILIGYQNCGTVENNSIFDNQSPSLGDPGCGAEFCISGAETYLRIRDSDPLRINSETHVPGLDSIRVSGSCGTGVNESAQISWNLTQGQGRLPVSQGIVQDACVNSRFSIAFTSPTDFAEGTIYQVFLTIAGVTGGVVNSNTSVDASGQVSVLLTGFEFDSITDLGYSPAVRECRRAQREIACSNDEREQSPDIPGCPIQPNLDLPCEIGATDVNQ